jgi:hypothetical protein
MMRRIAQFISVAALVGTVAPPCLFFTGTWDDLVAMQRWMLYATVAWFVSAPLWMEHKVA